MQLKNVKDGKNWADSSEKPGPNEVGIEPINLHIISVSADFIENATIRILRVLVCVQMDSPEQLRAVLPLQTAIRN